MLHVLVPQARESRADADAQPLTAELTAPSSTETGTGISRSDDNTIIIRIRLPETRTIVLMFVGALLFATVVIVLRRRNRHDAPQPPLRTDSDEPRRLEAPTANATSDTVEHPEPLESEDAETPAVNNTVTDESETISLAEAREMDEEIGGIDLPMLAPPSSGDMHMLQRLNEFIAQHINEVELSVNDLAAAVYMSRSNLFRRLKTLYGITPNEYLRRKRLLFAAALLRQNRYTISDVCFMVGFSSPSYFASCFKKHFGVLPKNYIRN